MLALSGSIPTHGARPSAHKIRQPADLVGRPDPDARDSSVGVGPLGQTNSSTHALVPAPIGSFAVTFSAQRSLRTLSGVVSRLKTTSTAPVCRFVALQHRKMRDRLRVVSGPAHQLEGAVTNGCFGAAELGTRISWSAADIGINRRYNGQGPAYVVPRASVAASLRRGKTAEAQDEIAEAKEPRPATSVPAILRQWSMTTLTPRRRPFDTNSVRISSREKFSFQRGKSKAAVALRCSARAWPVLTESGFPNQE